MLGLFRQKRVTNLRGYHDYTEEQTDECHTKSQAVLLYQTRTVLYCRVSEVEFALLHKGIEIILRYISGFVPEAHGLLLILINISLHTVV